MKRSGIREVRSITLFITYFEESRINRNKCHMIIMLGLGLCISAGLLYQLSYENPYVGSKPICGIHRTLERNETYEYYVNCGHTNEIKM